MLYVGSSLRGPDGRTGKQGTEPRVRGGGDEGPGSNALNLALRRGAGGGWDSEVCCHRYHNTLFSSACPETCRPRGETGV